MRIRVLVVAAVLGLAATACGSDSTAALTFRDTSVSQAELMSELREVANNQAYVENALQVPGDPRKTTANGQSVLGYDRTFVSAVISQRALLEIVSRECKLRDIKIDDATLQQTEQQFADPTTQKSIFDGFSKDYKANLIYGYTCFNALPSGFPDIDTANRWLTTALKDVKLNSRFGTWDPAAGRVVDPKGPVHASTTTTTAFPTASN